MNGIGQVNCDCKEEKKRRKNITFQSNKIYFRQIEWIVWYTTVKKSANKLRFSFRNQSCYIIPSAVVLCVECDIIIVNSSTLNSALCVFCSSFSFSISFNIYIFSDWRFVVVFICAVCVYKLSIATGLLCFFLVGFWWNHVSFILGVVLKSTHQISL